LQTNTVTAPRFAPWSIVGTIAGLATYVIVALVAITQSSTDAAAAIIVIPILVVITVPIARGCARRDGDPRVFTIVMAGLGVKLLGSLGRYWFAFVASGGAADAAEYDEWGRKLAPLYRSFDFSLDPERAIPGTGFIRVFTGGIYAIVGESRFAGFFIYAFIAFLGIVLFWRAFRIGVPDGDGRRYALLVMFLPSLVFWPSSIGKESWMLLALGLCAYGVASALKRRPVGALALIPGLIGATLVRPHLSLLVYCGFVFALLVRRVPSRNAATPALRLIAMTVMLGVGVFIVSQTTEFLGVESLTQESVQETLTTTAESTGQGGSGFTAVQVSSPLDFPLATVTVLFRPFPNEAGSAQSLIAAIEGMILLILCATSWRRLRSVPGRMRSQGYVAYSVGFILVFIFAFSSFSNFGLLARERTQMLPLLLVLLALPKALPKRRHTARGPDATPRTARPTHGS
jgi:hypothetical protein